MLDDDHGDVVNESTITNSLSYKMQKLWNKVAAVFEEIQTEYYQRKYHQCPFVNQF
jgi:hypothetical protein